MGPTIDEVVTGSEDVGVEVEEGKSSEVEGDDLGSQCGEERDQDGGSEHDGGGAAV